MAASSAEKWGALAEFQRQQEVSNEICQSIDTLKKRHQEWQEAVQVLLASVDLKVNQKLSEQSKLGTHSMQSKVASADQLKAVVVHPAEPAADVLRTGAGSPPVLYTTEASTGTSTGNGSTGLNKLPEQVIPQKGHLPQLLEEVTMEQQALDLEKENQGQCTQHRRALSVFVDSLFFEYFTGCIILANIIMIGVEAELSLRNVEEISWATTVEQVFLAVYTLELILRIAGGGLQTFWSCWFLLDFFLVCVGMIALVVAPVLTGGGNGMDGFEKLLVVRGLRLLRLARVLRMVGRFKVVWRLVSGLLTAWDTMFSATGLILLWLFIFGCVAVEIVAKDPDLLSNPDTSAILEYSFGSLPRSILTLVQFVTLDSIAGVYFPLIMAKPWLAIYFMPLMVLISIGLMNLVTAVLVEHALSHATREEELHRQRTKEKIRAALPELHKIFVSLDADGSGHVSREEAANVPLDVFPPKVLEAVSVESMADLFEMLDVDEGGTLSQSEFLEGLLNLLLLDVPIWAIQTLKLLRPMRKQANQIARDVDDLKQFLGVGTDLISM